MALPRSPAVRLLAAALLMAAPVVIQGQPRQQAVYVSVLDKTGAPVLDVAPSDLIVREDEVTREILRVVPADDPMQLALLVDDSEAAAPYITDYRRALPAFVTAIIDASGPRGHHQISVIGLAARPTIITQYTSEPSELVTGLQRVFAKTDTGTHLLDAIAEIGTGMIKRKAPRPVIVAVVTDGEEMSHRQHTQVLDVLRSSGAAFHAVTIGLPVNLSLDRGIVLERGSRETGGNYDSLLSGSALSARMRRLADELAHQHRVIYARPQSLIPPKRVVVLSARPDLTVRGAAAADRETQVRP
jgi:hypothetical protein